MLFWLNLFTGLEIEAFVKGMLSSGLYGFLIMSLTLMHVYIRNLVDSHKNKLQILLSFLSPVSIILKC